MSKADRSIKEKIKYSRSITPQTEEENSSTLPKIETKKPLANITTESYNFVSSVKKSGTSRDSVPGIISKDLIGSLTPQERALVEELAKKIEEQRKEIDQRNQTLMAIQRNFEGLSTMLKKEKELGSENKKRVLALTEDNNKLAEENHVLTKRVDDMIERLKKYEHELDSSAKDKKKINQSIEEQEALKSKIQELMSILERKKKEISDLEAKNKSLSAQIDKLKNTITGLENENKQSGLKLKEAKAELENSNKENDKLQKVILEYKLKAGDFDKLKEEHASLLVKKGDVDKENKELINEISVLRHENTTLKNHNKKLEEGVQTQNMQLRFGNQKEDALAQEVKELRKLLEARDAEVFELNLKVGDLQTSLQGEVQHRLKYKDLIERYDTLTKDGSEIRLIKKVDVDKINTDLEQLRAKTADYDELKKKVERLTVELQRLTGELQKKNEMIDRYASEKQFESGNNSKLTERIRALEEENKRLASHNQKLISALDFKNENEKVKDGQLNAEIESLKQKLEANLSSMGDINSKYKTLLGEKEALAKQGDIMKREIDIKNREMDSMKNKIDKLEAERDTRNREIDSLKKKIDNLESERDNKLKESDSNTTQLRKELSGLRDQYKNLQDATDRSISSLNKQVEDLKATNNRKDEEISQLKSSLSQIKSSLEAVTQENNTSQKALQSLQAQLKDLKGTLEIKENQVDAFKKENSELRAELEAKTKEIQNLAINVSELQDRIRTLTEKNDDLNKKNQEMAATLKQLLNDLHLARLRHKQSESTIEDLELKLKQTLNKLTDLDELKFRDKLAKLEDREKQFNKVVAKMDHAQSSLLISLSCCECMSSLKNPVTFLPCAHNYCEKCVPKNGSCKECGDNEPEYQYRNKLLEDVITKVSYNQVILESIKPKDD